METKWELEQVLSALKALDVGEPKAMSIDSIKYYSDIYYRREEQGKLSGLEPEYKNFEDLKSYLDGYNTIIGLCFPYRLLPIVREMSIDAISRVSIMAWEWDYHRIIRERIENILPKRLDYKIHIDSGPLPERQIAMQLGLALPGRSQLLIHDTYGTAFHLAFVLVRQTGAKTVFEPEFRLSMHCENCRRCQEHCPTQVLTGVADFDGSNCLSTLTQMKGSLSDQQMKSFGKQLYGCDHCQLSCPVNSPLFWGEPMQGELPVRKSGNSILPSSLLNLSQKAFKREYGEMGFSWRGVKVNKRNALINMGNDGRLHWIEVIEAYLKHQAEKDGEELVRVANWALDQIREKNKIRNSGGPA